jgi:hypothetical protein
MRRQRKGVAVGAPKLLERKINKVNKNLKKKKKFVGSPGGRQERDRVLSLLCWAHAKESGESKWGEDRETGWEPP